MKWSAPFCIIILLAGVLFFGIVGQTYDIQKSIAKNDKTIEIMKTLVAGKQEANRIMAEARLGEKRRREWASKSFLHDPNILYVKLLTKNKTDSCYYINSTSYSPPYVMIVSPEATDTTRAFYFAKADSFRIKSIRFIARSY
jgi:hypothetical protein